MAKQARSKVLFAIVLFTENDSQHLNEFDTETAAYTFFDEMQGNAAEYMQSVLDSGMLQDAKIIKENVNSYGRVTSQTPVAVWNFSAERFEPVATKQESEGVRVLDLEDKEVTKVETEQNESVRFSDLELDTAKTEQDSLEIELDLLPITQIEQVAQAVTFQPQVDMSDFVQPTGAGGIDSFMSVGDRGWHGQGVRLPEGTKLSAHQALVAAGLNWEVQLEPLFKSNGEAIDRKLGQLVTRSDNGASLGVVGARYTPIQNRSIFEALEALTRVDSHVKWETGGALWGGQTVFGSVQVDQFDVLGMDAHKLYILAVGAHDGSKAVTFVPTSVRVECQNLLRHALESAQAKAFVRHTKNAALNLDAARQVIGIVQQEGRAFANQAADLANIKMTDAEISAFVNVMLPEKEGSKRTTKLLNKRAEVLSGFNTPDIQPNLRGTAYAALQGFTYYETHKQARDAQTAFYNLTAGNPITQGEKARKFLLDYAQSTPLQRQSMLQLA